ncbi:ParB/RepB/Spo0J family partition protein [Leifsonia shinshuensis]|uniref:ParB/RepB/Spo0J family partition protein n=1 Tax=Leifsonia shinshuensis TaxID=150026 RepID=A0A7G6YEC9_9MICO|nr:ParB/RepB/Spo0J family partition protein [Leifsonia shinshuensis]QNE36844.1 ParB/RepB/Spo0J family partition protein [Leifsonia shinshuensis]
MNDTTTVTGSIEHLDPHTLTIETNVRPSAPITPAFIQSIKENGVLTPVLGHRNDDRTVTVRAGQRRVFAAREAGLTTIPVYLVDADEVAAERIVQQMVENDQREALTDGDRAAAFQQLAFEGLSVTAIARRTGTKPKEVKTALEVVENQVAASAIQEHQLTLDQAAVLIEFDGDDEIRADLIKVATTDPAQFAHAAQRARDEKARAKTKTDAEADLVGRGYLILDSDPG